jgi:hypothetical protein
MDLPFAPVETSVRILAEPFADGGRGDLLLIQPFDNTPYTQLLLCIPVEERADYAGFRFVHLSYAMILVTPIAIEFCPKVVNLAVLHPGPFAAYGSFTNLLHLDSSGIATHKANQLTFWGMIKRFRDKLNNDPMVLCLT